MQWSGHAIRESAAAPSRWCSREVCRRANGSGCVRRSRRVSSPAPVKYGYCNVGEVESGPRELVGRSGVLALSAPDAVRRPGVGASPVARRRTSRPGGAGCEHGDRRERRVGCGDPAWRSRGRDRCRRGGLPRGVAGRSDSRLRRRAGRHQCLSRGCRNVAGCSLRHTAGCAARSGRGGPCAAGRPRASRLRSRSRHSRRPSSR